MNTKRRTILVVDDDHVVLTLVKLFLEHAGYSVVTATDGVEGLDVFSQQQLNICLLLTDVAMPNMNGFQLADRVLDIAPRLPVLFMSGDARNASRGFGYVAKPFKAAELTARVGSILSRQPAGREILATAVAS